MFCADLKSADINFTGAIYPALAGFVFRVPKCPLWVESGHCLTGKIWATKHDYTPRFGGVFVLWRYGFSAS